MRRWINRIVIGVVALLAVTLIVGASWEAIARRSSAREFPATGKLVDIGGRRIHLDCRGSGSPTVVLIHGLDTGGAMSWTTVHDSIAATTRTCAYSRAGIMWSDPGPEVVTAKGVADDLHAALQNAGERPPFVLVGHSLGGPYEMVYTKHYGDQVAGVVMVDASHPEQMQRLSKVSPNVAATAVTTMKVVGSLTWTGALRLLGMLGGTMPNESPRDARVKAAYMSTSFDGALRETLALQSILDEAGTFRTLGDRPLVVLTAMKPLTPAERSLQKLDDAKAAEFKEIWRTLHVEESRWSSRARHVLVPDAGHYIQFDRPDVVIEATRSVVDSVRAAPPPPAPPPA